MVIRIKCVLYHRFVIVQNQFDNFFVLNVSVLSLKIVKSLPHAMFTLFQPQSNAERKRKYIAKLKENGGYEDFLKRKAEQEKEKRQRQKLSLLQMTEAKRNQLLCEARMKCRKRVEMHRKMKKEMNSQSKEVKAVYRTKSAIRKAATKIRKTLPLDPSKRNAVLSYLIHGLSDKDREEIFGKRLQTKQSNVKTHSSEIVQAVEKFYQNDNISRMSPNVKDCRLILNPLTGKKETTQIRHLMYRLTEVCDEVIVQFFCVTMRFTFKITNSKNHHRNYLNFVRYVRNKSNWLATCLTMCVLVFTMKILLSVAPFSTNMSLVFPLTVSN